MKSSSMEQKRICVSETLSQRDQRPTICLDLFLKNYLAANPMKSMYGFTLNRKRPGNFNLCFLANKNSTVQTWVRQLSFPLGP